MARPPSQKNWMRCSGRSGSRPLTRSLHCGQRQAAECVMHTTASVERRMERRSFAVYVGCVLMLLGTALSASTLESTIVPQGTIAGTTRRAAALVICRLGLAAVGLYLLVRRPRVTTVHLTAFAFVTVVALVA